MSTRYKVLTAVNIKKSKDGQLVICGHNHRSFEAADQCKSKLKSANSGIGSNGSDWNFSRVEDDNGVSYMTSRDLGLE